MAYTDPNVLRRQRRFWWITLSGLGTVTVVTFVLLLLLPAGDLAPVVSEETTYVTGPLREDGSVDYVAVMRERLAEPIPPGRNALVPMLKAVRPEDIGERQREALYAALEMEPLPMEGDYLIYLRKFMEAHCELPEAEKEAEEDDAGAVHESNSENSYDVWQRWHERITAEPWTRSELPCVAAWLEANGPPLELIEEATERSGYHMPMILVEAESGRRDFVNPYVGGVRTAADALRARATLRLGQDDPEAAVRDIATVYRLARLKAESRWVFDVLIASSLDAKASHTVMELAKGGHLTGPTARHLLDTLGELPQVSWFMGHEMLRYERLLTLRYCVQAHRYGSDGVFFHSLAKKVTGESDTSEEKDWAIDFNQLMRRVNEQFDRYEKLVDVQPAPERLRQMRQAEEQAKRRAEAFEEQHQHWSGRLKYNLLGPSYRRYVHTRFLIDEIRLRWASAERGFLTAAMDFRLAKTALALVAFEAEHGRYPKRLEELVPDYLSDVPIDLLAGGDPLTYRSVEGGAVVYSFGSNLADDGGSSKEDQGLPRDLVVRFGAALEKAKREAEKRRKQREKEQMKMMMPPGGS